MKRKFAALIVIALCMFSLIACTDNGKKIHIEGTKVDILYKGEGVTAADANKLGDYLKKEGFFKNDRGATMQLTKIGERYIVRFVYDKEYFLKNLGVEEVFKKYGIKISKEVFNNEKVDIALADQGLKDYKYIPYDETAEKAEESSENINKDNYEKVSIEGTKSEIYYKGQGVGESDAKRVGEFLKEKEFLSADVAADVLLTKEDERYIVRFVYNKNYFNKTEGLEDVFKQYGVQMSKEVFNGSKVDIVLTDGYFQDFKNIPYDVDSEQPKTTKNEEETEPGPPKEEEKSSLAGFDHDKAGGVEFFWKGVSDKESKTIADYIVQNGSFAGGNAQIYITKDGDRYILRFPVAPQYRNDEATFNEIRKISKQIKKNVFPNTPFTFQMTDERLVAVKSFDY